MDTRVNVLPFASGAVWRARSNPPEPVAEWLGRFNSMLGSPPLMILLTSVLGFLGITALAKLLALAAGRHRRVGLGFRLAAVAMVAIWYAAAWTFPALSTFFAAVSFIWWFTVMLLIIAVLFAPLEVAWRRRVDSRRKLAEPNSNAGGRSS